MTIKISPVKISSPHSRVTGSQEGNTGVQRSSRLKVHSLSIEDNYSHSGMRGSTFGTGDLNPTSSTNSSYDRLRKPVVGGLTNNGPESRVNSAAQALKDGVKGVTDAETLVTSVLNAKCGTTNIQDLTSKLTDAFGGNAAEAASAFNKYVGKLGPGLQALEFGLNLHGSDAQSMAGRFHGALAKFGVDAGQAAIIAKSGNPYVALAALGESMLPDNMQVVSGTLKGAASLWGSLVDAVDSGDTKALERWHQKNLSGEHGPVIKGYAEIGNLLAEHDVAGKVIDGMDRVFSDDSIDAHSLDFD